MAGAEFYHKGTKNPKVDGRGGAEINTKSTKSTKRAGRMEERRRQACSVRRRASSVKRDASGVKRQASWPLLLDIDGRKR